MTFLTGTMNERGNYKMAVKPRIGEPKASSPQTVADILNLARSQATANYQAQVPELKELTLENLKNIGGIIMANKNYTNQYLTYLVNRIGLTWLNSRMYTNPWSMFKKGFLEFGETVEEIFVQMSKPFKYDPVKAQQTVFQRNVPDVRTVLHILNYQYYYKQTINDRMLRQSFLSWNGVRDLIAAIVDSMYTALYSDEFLVMKYMLFRCIQNGYLKVITIPTVSTENMKQIASTMRGTTNMLNFQSADYNIAGVDTFSLTEDQYVIFNAMFDATMGVEVLASVFNMDKAEINGHRVLVDGFGKLNVERLNTLFGEEDWYEEPSQAELDAVNVIPAVVVDKNFFQVYDNLQEFTEIYNNDGLEWNYDLHVWRIFSFSIFSNAAVYAPGTPSVTSVTVSPASATVYPGHSFQLSAAVVTDWFAPQTVNWLVSVGDTYATVDMYGKVKISSDAPSGTKITVTATSAFDHTKSGSAELTVG